MLLSTFKRLIIFLLVSWFVASARMTDAGTVTELYQSDFITGPYIIDEPGIYRLAEDISFNPNSTALLGTDAYHAGFPLPNQFAPSGPYNPSAFGIGFFAAIAITAQNVVLDLAGHTIEQSKEHALLQRFFAVIELADQPFIPEQGPSDFGADIKSAINVFIMNGPIGPGLSPDCVEEENKFSAREATLRCCDGIVRIEAYRKSKDPELKPMILPGDASRSLTVMA